MGRSQIWFSYARGFASDNKLFDNAVYVGRRYVDDIFNNGFSRTSHTGAKVLIGVLLLIVCVILSAAASIFLKIGISSLTGSLSFSTLICNYMIWIGAVFYSAAFLGYIYVLRLVPLSLAQPVITAGASFVTALAAVLFFREQLTLANWMGFPLIIAGIFFLFLGRA